jgi:hypothetical protein
MDQPLKALPENYHQARKIDLQHDKKALIWLNVLALFCLAAIIIGLFQFVLHTRPDLLPSTGTFYLDGSSLLLVVEAIAVVLVILAIHELIHGLLFRLFTGERPRYAVRVTYAYAAMPDWYFPASHYLIIGMAPLVLIDLVCLILIPFSPAGWVLPLCVAITMNTGGAVGDLYIVATLLRCKPHTLVNDTGDTVAFFEPDN